MVGENAPQKNHLAAEVSPYLAAHAGDPVDWWPWGAHAFELARETDRPIFLSIGYQSCHWCHVMQRESFRDPETAEVLNRDFVPVKLDRELRPDVDALYMSYVQAITGRGGWPMSVFLTPDLRPFFGGTYFPLTSPSRRMPSFRDVLAMVTESWTNSRSRTMRVAADALESVREINAPKGLAPWVRATIDAASATVLAMHDAENGGFGGAPKFPMSSTVSFMLTRHRTAADEAALHAAIQATLAMLRGGIWDQAGGGLFRYATDDTWLVPHFEKMLYDQAGLLSNLAELIRVAHADEFTHTARRIASFVDDALRRDAGGYWSSLDAEAGGAEGAPYAWTRDELAAVLDPADLTLAERHLGVTAAGNWEGGKTILTRRRGRAEDADAIDTVLAKIARARADRPQPAIITNALVGWNAMLARGLLEAGAALADDRIVEQGETLLRWLLSVAVDGDTVRHAIGDPSTAGVFLLEDHAAVTAACLTGARLTADDSLTATARALHEATTDRFLADAGPPFGAGFVMTTAPELPLAPFEQSDTPTPSGASIHAENEWTLASLLEEEPRTTILTAVESQMGDIVRVAPHMAGHALGVAARRTAEGAE